MPRKDPEERNAYGREYERQKRLAMSQDEIDAKNAQTRAKRAADPEKYRAADRARHARNRERRNAQAKASYARHKDRRNAEIRVKRAADPEPFRAVDRARDPVKRRASRNASYARRKDVVTAKTRAKRAADPTPFREQDKKRSGTPKRNAWRRGNWVVHREEINAERRGKLDPAKVRQANVEKYHRNPEEARRTAKRNRKRLVETIPAPNTGQPWTAEHDEIVMSSRTLRMKCAKTGRSAAAVQARIKMIRKKQRGEVGPVMAPRRYRPWTPEEDVDVIRDDISIDEICDLTGRSKCAVTQRRWKFKNRRAEKEGELGEAS